MRVTPAEIVAIVVRLILTVALVAYGWATVHARKR